MCHWYLTCLKMAAPTNSDGNRTAFEGVVQFLQKWSWSGPMVIDLVHGPVHGLVRGPKIHKFMCSSLEIYLIY